jgi:hypothetical protein
MTAIVSASGVSQTETCFDGARALLLAEGAALRDEIALPPLEKV